MLFILGAVLGRISTGTPAPVPEPTESPTATQAVSTTAPPRNVPYDGPVVPVWPDRVSAECRAGSGHDVAANLLDGDPDTIWRCAGTGVGASLTFTFDTETELVGARVINGNIVEDRFLRERRILSLRWDFPDGSWLLQGFAANDRTQQEIRFPPITVEGSVKLTVQSSTIAGDPSPIYDAVSISELDFLTSA